MGVDTWVFTAETPTSYLGIPITGVAYESDHGRIFGADMFLEGKGTCQQMKAVLTTAYGEPTTERGSTGYTAWDWGKGSGIIQLSSQAKFDKADVHMERQQ